MYISTGRVVLIVGRWHKLEPSRGQCLHPTCALDCAWLSRVLFSMIMYRWELLPSPSAAADAVAAAVRSLITHDGKNLLKSPLL